MFSGLYRFLDRNIQCSRLRIAGFSTLIAGVMSGTFVRDIHTELGATALRDVDIS